MRKNFLVGGIILSFLGATLCSQTIIDGTTETTNAIYTVGATDSGNSLIISNGGELFVTNDVSGRSAIIGSNNAAHLNSVLVWGTDSSWTNQGNLYIGLDGRSNSMTISNGAFVLNNEGFIGNGSASSNNIVTVTGTDSIWSNRSGLYIGNNGEGNRLIMESGATVFNNEAYMGVGTRGSNNFVSVSGADSVWSNRSTLYIGFLRGSNVVSVADAGIVYAANVQMGGGPAATNNLLTIAGNSSQFIVTNSGGTSLFEVRRGAVSQNGGTVMANRLLLTNPAVAGTGAVYNLNGGALITDGTTFSNGQNFVVGTNATFVARSGVHEFQNELRVGDSGWSNSMVISNGADVFNSVGYIGQGSNSSNNTALVTGSGSLWSNRSELYVGNAGSGNSLVITNGGAVFNGLAYLGVNTPGRDNFVAVGGAGSIWSNRSSVYIGFNRGSNAVRVTDGGTVYANHVYLGNGGTATNNMLSVSGSGSLWTNLGDMHVGYGAAGNRMTVSDGGDVINGAGYIGHDLASSNNVVSLSGAGSLWSNRSDLHVGYNGASNFMIISNGAMVENAIGYMGFAGSSSNNVAIVTGNGSVWSNLNSLLVGRSGEKNTLNISDGGAVFNVAGTVGSFSTSSNNTVIVSGHNSLWSNAGTLRMGNLGQSNLLVISNGGQVVNNSGNIGYFISASNNTVLVMDAGSRWNNRDLLYVGRESRQNALTIDNGGQVLANSMIVGGDASSTNNLVTINGVGTELIVSNTYDIQRGTNVQNGGTVILGGLLVTNPTTGGTGGVYLLNGGLLTSYSTTYSNGQDFVIGTNATLAVQLGLHEFQNGVRVGNNGGGNSFIATNGSIIRMDELIIGAQPDSLNNQVILSLTTWTNRFDVSMGNLGTLMISNAAQLQNTDAFIGGDSNLIIVTGSGSSWTNLDRLHIGNDGEENRLIVSNGGYVFSANARLGWNDDSSSNNHILITGSGSLWSNLYGISVGDFSQSNSLSIENGGQVFSQSGVIGNVLWASNNLVSISGAGSLFSIDDELLVGGYIEKNHLFVSDGGELRTAGLTIGLGEESTNNTVVLNDSSSLIIVTNSAGTGTYDIRRGTNVQNGGTVIANNLLVTNNAFFSETGGVYHLNGGTLITDGTIHSNGQNFLIGTNATFVARSGEHRFQGDIRVGDLGEGNTFIVTNGSLGRANSLFVGYDTTASNNLTILSGAGTTWTNNLGVVVGVYGMNNRLVVSNGAVLAGTSGTLGATAGSSSNSALIVGAGTIWTNTGRLLVGGVGGRSNLLEIIDGAYVASSNGVIGLHWSSISNVVVVSGVNAVWSNATSLVIGDEGGHNLLIVSNGGGVHSQTGTIGLNLPAETASNRVFVTGSGSFWSNAGTIIIGNSSWSNSLTINDGGLVMTDSMILGNNPAASRGNRLEIADTASQLIVTNGSGTGALNVRRGTVDQNGGTVIANNLLVTNPAVAGTGSVYNLNGGTLITDGTTHSNGQNFLLGTNATFVARSGDHRFQNELRIGDSGWSNSMIISNGAEVFNSVGTIGQGGVSSNNAVLVTGDDSIWSNAGALTVGFQGGWNALTISNGGTVQATNMVIGQLASSTNNLVTVSGVGSELIVTNAAGTSVLDVRRGTLDIEGGQVFANTLLATNAESVIEGYGIITGDTVVSNGATFDVQGLLTNQGGVLFGAGADITALTNGLDVFRIEAGTLTNEVDFSIEAGASGQYSLDFAATGDFLATGGTITWSFDAAPVYGHFGGVRSANNIFSTYQNMSGQFVSGFNVLGIESYQYMTTYFDGTFYYLTVIPEPSTYALLVLGAICAGVILRKKRLKSSADTCSLQQDIAD